MPDNPFVIAICPIHAELGILQDAVSKQLGSHEFPIKFEEGALKLCSDQDTAREYSSLVELQKAIDWFIDRLATDFGYSGFEIADHSSEFRSDDRVALFSSLSENGE